MSYSVCIQSSPPSYGGVFNVASAKASGIPICGGRARAARSVGIVAMYPGVYRPAARATDSACCGYARAARGRSGGARIAPVGGVVARLARRTTPIVCEHHRAPRQPARGSVACIIHRTLPPARLAPAGRSTGCPSRPSTGRWPTSARSSARPWSRRQSRQPSSAGSRPWTGSTSSSTTTVEGTQRHRRAPTRPRGVDALGAPAGQRARDRVRSAREDARTCPQPVYQLWVERRGQALPDRCGMARRDAGRRGRRLGDPRTRTARSSATPTGRTPSRSRAGRSSGSPGPTSCVAPATSPRRSPQALALLRTDITGDDAVTKSRKGRLFRPQPNCAPARSQK